MSNPLPQDQPVASALIAQMKAGRRDELGGGEVGTPLRQGMPLKTRGMHRFVMMLPVRTDRFTAYISFVNIILAGDSLLLPRDATRPLINNNK